MARPVPVLPEVGSTIVPPGRSRPSRSADSISAAATRSLIDPPGLKDSSLATSWGASPAAMRESLTTGVWPIVSRIESFTSTLPAVLAIAQGVSQMAPPPGRRCRRRGQLVRNDGVGAVMRVGLQDRGIGGLQPLAIEEPVGERP